MSLENFINKIEAESFSQYYGRVQRVRHDSVRFFLPNVRVGALCEVETKEGRIPVEIVSLDPEGHVGMPLNELGSVRLGDRIYLTEEQSVINVGDDLLGRVVDSTCNSYDGAKLVLKEQIPLYGSMLNPMDRALIHEPLDVGVRAVNACLTTGKGQRQGVFAGSGVGKSVLLGMMARMTEADVVVIGLIGERGREVREFIAKELGEAGLKKSVLVVETADKSAVRRVRGAFTATAIAEYFRNKKKNVLLLMDSLTRFAMAQREIGIAAGEPPTTKGYTPSVFSLLSKLVERAGNWGENGSITGLYTVLVEGDDLEDPVADAARAILDGHIVLARRLANRGHYPAIDILTSISRVMDQVISKEHRIQARKIKELSARFQENEDAIHYGMYQRGTDPMIDEAIEKEQKIIKLLRQGRDDTANFMDSENSLAEVFGN